MTIKTFENIKVKGENASSQQFFFLFSKSFQPFPWYSPIFELNKICHLQILQKWTNVRITQLSGVTSLPQNYDF